MSTIHVLHNTHGSNYAALTHQATPTGNNAVGTPWKTCWLASFSEPPSSRLPVGNGAGQITAAENAQIVSGDLLEIPFEFTDDPDLNAAQRNAMIDAIAESAWQAKRTEFLARFKFYGYTRP